MYCYGRSLDKTFGTVPVSALIPSPFEPGGLYASVS